MTHYKYWKDEDGYIRAATWAEGINVISMARFDPIAQTRCYMTRFLHKGPGAAEAEFYTLPGCEKTEREFCAYMEPLMRFKQLGGQMAELLSG